MKKLLGLVVAALLFCGFAGQAMATTAGFSDGSLIRVIYDTSTNEEAANVLGTFTASGDTNYINLSTLTSTPATIGASVSLSAVGAGSWSEVQVAYVEMVRSSQTVSIGGTSPLSTQGGEYTGFTSALSSMYTTYGASNTAKTGVSTGNSASYYAKMDGGGTSVGTMAGFTTPTYTVTEANLGNGSVAFQLYNWVGSSATGAGTDIASLNTVYNSGTGTFSTTIAAPAAAVPVPPSVLLLAPGLLGLVGLRRRWFN
jgi:hypothetical protein